MRYLLSAPSQIKATIQLPASKSISNRALIIHALSKGDDVLSNLSDCDDTQVMIKALTEGNEVIDILAAGTAMRFLTAYLSSTPGIHTITGTERMQQRPIQILVNALRELGAHIEYVRNEGFPPLRIEGRELTGSEGQCEFTIHISPVDDRSGTEKRSATPVDRRNRFTTLHQPDFAIDERFRRLGFVDIRPEYPG